MLKFVLILFVCTCAFGGDLDVWNTHKDGLCQAAKAYVAEFSTEKEWKKWNDNIEEMMETRSFETIALDWFYDNQSDLKDAIPSTIMKACFFFIKFVATQTAPPFHIRANITGDNLKLLQSYLEQCVKRVKEPEKGE